MRNTFLTRTRLWLGSMVLLALAVVVPVAPAMAIPVFYAVSGPLNGGVVIDESQATPFQQWGITDGGLGWSHFTDTVNTNANGGPGFNFLQTVNTGSESLIFFPNVAAASYSFQTLNDDGSFRAEGGGALTGQSAVPEPSTILLLATGLLGLAGARWWQLRQERS